MVDGALSFMAMFFGYREHGTVRRPHRYPFAGRRRALLRRLRDGDGRHLAVAPIEPQFYVTSAEGAGSDRWCRGISRPRPQHRRKVWPALKLELAAIFKTKTRDEWCEFFAESDACVTPVLTLAEAERHPHNRARGAFIEVGGLLQNAPAPRFSRTAADTPRPPRKTGADTAAVLADWGVDPAIVARIPGRPIPDTSERFNEKP